MLVGILAFQAAFNWGGKVTGSKGAFLTVASQPFGKLLLFLIAIGLLGYVVWQIVQTIWDPEHSDTGLGAVGRRASYLISGVIYGSLALFALRVVFSQPSSSNSNSSGGSSSSSEGTATLLSQPFGKWLVGLVGVAVVAYGFYCFYRAYSTQFRRRLKLYEMSAQEEKWSTRISRFGLVAKGIVSVITGYFFIQAARASDPSQAKNTEGVLQIIQQQPYGAWLMGIVALGLVAYGIHLIIQARYRRISP